MFYILIPFVAKLQPRKGYLLWAQNNASSAFCKNAKKCKQSTNLYGVITRKCKIIRGWHF